MRLCIKLINLFGNFNKCDWCQELNKWIIVLIKIDVTLDFNKYWGS